MGKDKHTSITAAHIIYFNRKHLFHIVEDDFPLPEGAIIGLRFFQKYDKYLCYYT